MSHQIQVIQKENGRQSSARNLGIKHSNGEYLLFLDSDDYLLPDHIMQLYQGLKKTGTSVSMCKFAKDDSELEDKKHGNFTVLAGDFTDLATSLICI